MLYRSFLYRLISLILFLQPGILMAQAVYEGQVIDKDTEVTLPGVTVKLMKENKASGTNARGYYKLVSTEAMIADSLQFSSIGYQTLKIAVSAYQQNMFITLEQDITQLKSVTITDKKKVIPAIHQFRMADIRTNHYNSPNLPFYAERMFAVLAKADKKNGRITSIKVGRRGFNDPNKPSGYAQC